MRRDLRIVKINLVNRISVTQLLQKVALFTDLYEKVQRYNGKKMRGGGREGGRGIAVNLRVVLKYRN